MGLYRVTRVDSLDGLASAASSWNRLVENSLHLIPTSSYAWISSYLEHRLRDRERWVCYFAHEGEELVGVLPLLITPAKIGFPGRRALHLPGDLHTISADLVCGPDDSVDVIEALIRRVFEDYPDTAYLAFSRIPDGSPVLQWLHSRAGAPWHTIEWDGNGAYLATTDSYATYRAQLSSKFRHNLSHYGKKVAKLSGYSLQTLVGAEATPNHLNRFMQVEAANWKGRAGTAILTSEPLRQFYVTLVDRLYECGWLRWDFIDVEHTPIAASFALQLGSRQIGWKIAYNEEYEQLSVGTILLDGIIRGAFEDPQIDELNLLSDYPYVAKWRVSHRPYYNINLYRPNPTTLLFHYAPARLRIELRRIPLVHRVWMHLKSRISRARA